MVVSSTKSNSSSSSTSSFRSGVMMDTLEAFGDLPSRGKVVERLGFVPFFPLLPLKGDSARFNRGEVWGDVEDFLIVGVNSHTLWDFLCISSWESTNILCLSGLRGCVTEGELGGVVMFCMEPGGEELGVMWTMEIGPGEVLRARGDTGVVCLRCLSDLITFLLNFSLKESALCGEEGSFGDGVPLDELSRV